ncbi:hypothetical protein ACH5RR_018132 [Cinchona calisaya]|uniref:Uncharacterized protein n=1 Tax=Cinchona calisaya TaxID=153742 RepID=A0ABD2ZLW1_9GENT
MEHVVETRIECVEQRFEQLLNQWFDEVMNRLDALGRHQVYVEDSDDDEDIPKPAQNNAGFGRNYNTERDSDFKLKIGVQTVSTMTEAKNLTLKTETTIKGRSILWPDGEDVEYEEEEDDFQSLVVHRLMLSSKHEDVSQRHSLFKSRCTIADQLFDVIIDSGSCENIVVINEDQPNDNTDALKALLDEFYEVPQHGLDLAQLPNTAGKSKAVATMAKDWQAVHDDLKEKLEKGNANYKQAADKHCKKVSFEVGE